tara:strand:+ start:346 stop:528 length:183 start_codon:yes stop_codon:yes gene_type:complete
MNVWLLAAGLIMLPLFLPIGATLIFLSLYGDFTKKYLKEIKDEKKYSKEEYGTDVLEQGV